MASLGRREERPPPEVSAFAGAFAEASRTEAKQPRLVLPDWPNPNTVLVIPELAALPESHFPLVGAGVPAASVDSSCSDVPRRNVPVPAFAAGRPETTRLAAAVRPRVLESTFAPF